MPYKFWRYARRVDADTLNLYTPDMTNALVIDTGTANTTKVFGQTATTKILKLYANQTDLYPAINLTGNGSMYLAAAAGNPIRLFDGATEGLTLGYVTANNAYEITSIVNNKDLLLATTGTGVLKFGTHTGSGDVACNGSIAIKDAAGNARKLMTTA